MTHRIKVRWPIRFEVAASGVVVALLVSLFLGYYAPARYRDEALGAKHEAAAGMAEMVALSVGVGLRLNAPSTVAAAITWARRDSALVYLAVIDPTNVLFASFNPDSLRIEPSTVPGDSVVERDGRLFVAAPIQFAGENLGRLIIGTSLVPLHARIAEQRRIGLTVSLAVLTVGVLLSVVLAGVMTRPILALREAAEHVAGGSYDVTIPEPSGNEIGALTRAFATMVERIRTQLSTLELQAGELVAARDTALQATTAKSAFLAMMSHEIRTPMNGVLGMLQLLRQERLSGVQRDFADIAYRSGESLLTLINDILDFSKIEANKLELEQIEFDLAETLDEITQVVGERASSKGLELVCIARHTVPTGLRGDPCRLRQVLVNLCGNAVKFTPAGDVILTVSVVERSEQDVLLRFEVADTGIGLNETDRIRLFQPFAQADVSTTRSYGGTGLGLSISKQLVALMGGGIYVRSEVGAGSTFGFTARFGLASLAQRAENRRSLRNATVLLVDDHRGSRRATQLLLASHGATSVGARDDDALSVAQRTRSQRGRIDALVLVIRHGTDNAVALAERLRAAADLPAHRVLLVPAHPDQMHARDAAASRGYAFLTHRFARRHVLSRVRELLATDVAGVPPRPKSAVRGEPDAAGGGAAFPGRTVLVAEDNPVNQRVVTEFLRRLMVSVTVVPNGATAVDAVRDGGFDLVLMDCHMPVMDGFEATRRLRQSGMTSARLPIIALTASAMASDKEQCIAAGMDGFLTKPLRESELTATLAHWFDVPVRAAAAQPSQAPTVSHEHAIDLEQLTALIGDDPTKVHEFLTLFLESSLPLLDELDTALRNHDPRAVLRAAHALKGSAASMGIREVASLAQALEDVATTPDWDLARQAGEQLTAAFARAQTAIARIGGEYALAS